MNDVPLLVMGTPCWVIMVCLLDMKEEQNNAICTVGQLWLLGYSYATAPSLY
jgi:hypothetical protein